MIIIDYHVQTDRGSLGGPCPKFYSILEVFSDAFYLNAKHFIASSNSLA